MESEPWNSRNISLSKDKISQEELEENLDQVKIRNMVKNNEREAWGLLRSFPDLDTGLVDFLKDRAGIDGSLDISSMEPSSHFLQKEGVCFDDGKAISTRGYDYVCSLDQSLTSMQKIKKYKDTIFETALELSRRETGKAEKLVLLDYLKNGLITILNSFIYQEKAGEAVDTSKEYEDIRSALMREVESVISCSLDLILHKDKNDAESVDFGRVKDTVEKAVEKLAAYDREHKFPSFYVSRPEVTHPLTIIGASLLAAHRYQDASTVVGLPSGGTELAFTTKIFMDKMGEGEHKLVLLPMSLHSLKNSARKSNGNGLNKAGIKKYLENGSSPVLVCDDNTSTGRTLETVKGLILEAYPGKKVYCSVAEADIVRSRLDKDTNKRTHVANIDIYTDAVNILPVSKIISPKSDLKEVIEKRKIIRYYKDMQAKQESEVDQLEARILAHVNESGMDYSGFTEENAIMSFRGTFLSNFYAVPVQMEGKTYPSVEHAYQGAKFLELDWASVSKEAKDEIKETMRLRGYAADIVYSEQLFMDTKMAAGHTKIIADILRKYGYVDKGWAEKRINLMISLLLQKFKSEDMRARLEATNGKELIEGNTWEDTLWGVCEGKGRNILGVALMEIRDLKN